MNADNTITPVIRVIKDFSLEQTLECGQCFRYYKLGNQDYFVLARNKLLRAKQEGDTLYLYCSTQDYDRIWKGYFDLERDYGSIKNRLSEKDVHLQSAILEKHGVRLLRQEPWETLMSFIISQNKQIPHIKKLIEVLSQSYGTPVCTDEGYEYYAFPTPKQLQAVTEEQLRHLKVGFRAPYLHHAISLVLEGQVDLEAIESLSYDEAKAMLKTIKGVGDKIADCVLLFAYGRYEVFPTDVWVKRVMEYYYFKEITPINKVQDFSKSYFGELAGFAQQYLFYYARDNKLGK